MSLLLFSDETKSGLDFGLTGVVPGACSFARASSGSVWAGSGVMATLAANAPRFEIDPSTGQALGLLYEPQRTNIVANSAQWQAFSWGGTSLDPINAYAAAPDGTVSAWIVPSGTTGFLQRNYPLSVDATSWTVSFYAKAVASGAKIYTAYFGINGVSVHGGVIYDFDTDTVLSGEGWVREKCADGWVRLVWTKANNGTSDTLVIRIDDTGSSVFGKTLFWGLQIENAASASSYISTVNAAVTRASDQLSFVVPNGMTTLCYTFDDGSTQNVAVSAGAYTVPTSLNRKHIKRIQGL